MIELIDSIITQDSTSKSCGLPFKWYIPTHTERYKDVNKPMEESGKSYLKVLNDAKADFFIRSASVMIEAIR